MFCRKCGREIKEGIADGGMKNKMMVIGIVAVVAIVLSAVKLLDSSKFHKTPCEKILAMPWKDLYATSAFDLKSMLDREGIICGSENGKYDIYASEAIDKEVVDALVAYQRYVPTLPDIKAEEQLGYTLIYLNEDEVPECLVWTSGMIYVLSYNNGIVQMFNPESVYQFFPTFLYTPRMGKFCVKTVLGLRSATDWVVAELDLDFNKIGDAWWDNDYVGNYYNYLNDAEVEAGEIEAYIDSFGFEVMLGTGESESILSAYDALRNSKGVSEQ